MFITRVHCEQVGWQWQQSKVRTSCWESTVQRLWRSAWGRPPSSPTSSLWRDHASGSPAATNQWKLEATGCRPRRSDRSVTSQWCHADITLLWRLAAVLMMSLFLFTFLMNTQTCWLVKVFIKNTVIQFMWVLVCRRLPSTCTQVHWWCHRKKKNKTCSDLVNFCFFSFSFFFLPGFSGAGESRTKLDLKSLWLLSWSNIAQVYLQEDNLVSQLSSSCLLSLTIVKGDVTQEVTSSLSPVNMISHSSEKT